MAAWAAPSVPRVSPLAVHFIAIDGPARPTSPGDSRLDLGELSARGSGSGITVRKRVGVRLEGVKPTARVSVRLTSELLEGTVRVDGRLLGTFPQLIDGAHRVGVTVAHDIEITVPAHVPAGPLLGNIVWIAEQE